MAPSRNFRTTYYKTLGVPVVQHIVDVDAAYDALFAEPVVNTTQLMKLALEVGIAPSFRALAWKVLCGVLPPYKCLWEMAERERQHMYDDLVDAAAVLQLPCQDEYRPAMPVEEAGAATGAHSASESAKTLIGLYHTYRNDVLRAKPLRVLNSGSDGGRCIDTSTLIRVVGALETVLPSSVADQFWCFTRVVEVLEEAQSFVDPTFWNEAFGDLTIYHLETLFIRALDCIRNGVRT